MGADASGDAFIVSIDGDGVGSAIGVRVVGDHLRKVQGGGARHGQRRADVARAVADHEGGLLGCERLGGDDQVAFVLAVGRVKDNHEFAVGWVVLAVGVLKLNEYADRTLQRHLVSNQRPSLLVWGSRARLRDR